MKETIPLPDNYDNYVAKHWHGEHSLVRSYWVNGVLLNIIIGLFITILSNNSTSLIAEHPTLISLFLIGIWLFICTLTIWQIVGIWRAADNYSKHSRKKWGTAAQFVTILGVLGFLNTLSTTAIPQIKEYGKIAFGDDSYSEYSIRILRDATELSFSGGISFGATKDIKKYLNNHPAIKTIHLNSRGGRVGEARQLAALIQQRELNTYTSKGCYSACILPYAAGKKRLIDKNAELGFHQYNFPGVKQHQLALEYQKDKQFLISQGIDENFVQKIYKAPNKDLWKPSHSRLHEVNFITHNPDYDDVAISNISPSDLNNLDSVLLETPLYAAIKKEEPQVFQKIKERVRNAIEKGHTMAQVRNITLPLIQGVLYDKLPYTSNKSIIGFTQLVVDQLKYYKKEAPIKCYKVAIGKSTDVSDLPQDLKTRELEINAEVIRNTSTTKNIPKSSDIQPILNSVFRDFLKNNSKNKLKLILKKQHSEKQKPKYCNAMIDFYEHVLDLPHNRGSKVLRFMFSNI